MKTTVIAIALLMGGAAFAQTGTTTAQPQMDHSKMDHSKMDHSKMEHSTSNMSTMNQPATSGSTMNQSTMNHNAMSSNMSGVMIQPGNTAPERDARGIPVISAPAFVPAGWNGAVGPAVGGPLVDPSTGVSVDADEVYPACTAQITDNCVQAYAAGRR